MDRKHYLAIATAARDVLQSSRAYLDGTKGTRRSDGRYRKWELDLDELRRRMTAADCFNLRHRLCPTEEEQNAYDALETLVSDIGVHPQAPPTAGALPPMPNEETLAHLADFVADVEKLRGLQTSNKTAGAKKLSKEERNTLVSNYLKKHKARAAKGEVSIREVSQETGVPTTSVERTSAWRALQDRLEREGRSRQPRKRKAQAYTAEMDAVVGDPELQELIEEQHNDYDPSPLDKGRRPKVRAKKKF